MILPPLRSTLFPYTTLFRSRDAGKRDADGTRRDQGANGDRPADRFRRGAGLDRIGGQAGERSEEHTSELQSLRHLVCRLLLEKKKDTTQKRTQETADV